MQLGNNCIPSHIDVKGIFMKNLETIQKISISVLDSPILHLLLVLLPAVF